MSAIEMKASQKGRNGVKTATSRAIPTDDDALVLEALRIAAAVLGELAEVHERIYPSSPLVERNRVFAERMTDLASRLSA